MKSKCGPSLESRKTRETAIKRMNSFLSNSQNRNNNNISEIRLTNVDEENLNYVVNYIKDYAVQHLSVKERMLKYTSQKKEIR